MTITLKKDLLITIDGPAGAGKTTTSRLLAERLNYKYIDTGALYRGVAFEAKRECVDPNDDGCLQALCDKLKLVFIQNHKGLRLFSNDVDITDKIRTPEITMLASAVSAKPAVRKYLLHVQRTMGEQKKAVFEGRDMGTVVFPDADVKFYLDASMEVRARRRFNELSPIASQSMEKVQKDMKRRDENDSSRKIAPLKPAEDAILIDSSHISVEQVVNLMLSSIRKFS
jgi:cytidylate kinase